MTEVQAAAMLEQLEALNAHLVNVEQLGGYGLVVLGFGFGWMLWREAVDAYRTTNLFG